jgi:hypothetical protein
MAPVPLWARAGAVVAALVTLPVMAFAVATGVALMASVAADVDRTTSYAVGAAPRLNVDAQFSEVVIGPGRDDRIVVEDQHAARTVTRVGAANAVRAIDVATRQQGDVVTVVQVDPNRPPAVIDRNARISIRVPSHTALDVASVGSLEIQGVDAVLRVRSAGSAVLSDLTLRDTSALTMSVGELVMRNVTVSGRVAVTDNVGAVRFDGALSPGASSLDVRAGAGGVTIALPRPTDAHATIATQVSGSMKADPSWHFVPDQETAPRSWSADLGPSPKGTVNVSTTVGDVQFNVRQ